MSMLGRSDAWLDVRKAIAQDSAEDELREGEFAGDVGRDVDGTVGLTITKPSGMALGAEELPSETDRSEVNDRAFFTCFLVGEGGLSKLGIGIRC